MKTKESISIRDLKKLAEQLQHDTSVPNDGETEITLAEFIHRLTRLIKKK